MTSARPKNHNGHLTSGRLLARNTLWNLIGTCAPMAAAVLAIPILIHDLGKERFGILTLAWALIGYANLFNLGLGRALTQIVALKLGDGKDHEIPSLTWTSLLLMFLLGVFGAGLVAALSPWLVYHALNVPSSLQRETLKAFWLLALSIPLVICTVGLRGLLEAHQRFVLTNCLRAPTGVLMFAGPLLVLPFSHSLVPVVGALVAVRILDFAALFLVCLRVLPWLKSSITLERSAVGPLLRFGGWMTVTNVVSPLMVTLDRFLIAGLISLTAVTYYATSYELITKFVLLPGALMGVMFPAFSTSSAQSLDQTALLYGRSVKSVLVISFPVILCTVALAQSGLKQWLGADFALHSYRLLQILAIGVFVNSLAQVPFTLLHSVGRPDLTGTLHLIELPLYLGALWWLIVAFGAEGAAIAWTARVTFDALWLFVLAKRMFPKESQSKSGRPVLLAMLLLILVVAALIEGPIAKGVFLLGTILCFVAVMWFHVLTPGERTLIQSYGWTSSPPI